jgi:hypothetical protein
MKITLKKVHEDIRKLNQENRQYRKAIAQNSRHNDAIQQMGGRDGENLRAFLIGDRNAGNR